MLRGLSAPAWMRDALCREYPDVEFFIELGGNPEPAKAICRRCAVQDECATYAVEQNIKDGIWGGTSAVELNRKNRVPRAVPAQLEWSGLALTTKQWAERLGIPVGTIRTRLRAGWSVERALTEPPGTNLRQIHRIEFNGESLTLREWSARVGINEGTLGARLNNYGWSIERALSETPDPAKSATARAQ
jgi:WhiB family transcriptional regulator, redox-sensing transcriptional regulator